MAKISGLALGVALLLGSSTAFAATLARDGFACQDLATLKAIGRNFTDGRPDDAARLFRSEVQAGNCTWLRGGDDVIIVDIDRLAGFAQVRVVSDGRTYWTLTNVVSASGR